MWALDNRTPFAAERNWIRDKHGAHNWLVAVRASFDIRADGRLTLADVQAPPLLAPEYRGDPAQSSLLLDSDLLAVKPGTDVVLDACAHAPGGRPAATVPVTLMVGSIEKTLLVHGPRVYYRGSVGLTTSKPRLFTSEPICYESAFGGADLGDPDPSKHRIDTRNPVGKGFAVNPARLENHAAHTVEYAEGNPAKSGPAGFGPIASFWSPRLELAGTYDARWEKTKKPLLPDDYDDRFALSSPPDQRVPGGLRGGEIVTLVNMTPEGAIRFAVPEVALFFRTRVGGRVEEHRATLATLFIAPERRWASVTWQSALPVRAADADYLDLTVVSADAA